MIEMISDGWTRQRLVNLFAGRGECYFEDMAFHQGSAIEKSHSHFRGETDIGIYPRRDDGTVSWGCVDIDTGDMSDAVAVGEVLSTMGLYPWVETSRSKGYHVWVFPYYDVPCEWMRTTLVEAVRQAGLPDNTEINPKQVTATSKGVGNCVRLPYGKWWTEHPGRNTMILSPDGECKAFNPEEFIGHEFLFTDERVLKGLYDHYSELAERRKAAEQAIRRLRQHEADGPVVGSRGGGKSQRAWRILNGLERAEAGERNNCAFVMAAHLHGSKVPLAEARFKMLNAVENFFDDGPEFREEALKILDRFYGAEA